MKVAKATQVHFVSLRDFVLEHGHLDEGIVFAIIILLVLQSMVWKYDLQCKDPAFSINLNQPSNCSHSTFSPKSVHSASGVFTTFVSGACGRVQDTVQNPGLMFLMSCKSRKVPFSVHHKDLARNVRRSQITCRTGMIFGLCITCSTEAPEQLQ